MERPGLRWGIKRAPTLAGAGRGQTRIPSGYAHQSEQEEGTPSIGSIAQAEEKGKQETTLRDIRTAHSFLENTQKNIQQHERYRCGGTEPRNEQ